MNHACLKHPNLLCASLQSGAYQADCAACRAAMTHFATAYAGYPAYAGLVAQIKSELTARINARTHAADVENIQWGYEDRQAIAQQRTRYAAPWLQPSDAGIAITDAKRYSCSAPMWKE